MGDTEVPPSKPNSKESKTSQKESKSSENLATYDAIPNSGPENSKPNVETVFKNPDSSNSSTEKLAKNVTDEQDVSIKSDLTLTQRERTNLKNRSDIFSLNCTNNNPTATIFSFTGVPSKNIPYQKQENSSDITSAPLLDPRSSDTLKSNESSGSSITRNPLTGTGVNSNDEFKVKSHKRKDGNPVLGLGYDDEVESFHSRNSQRIPPGGHSKGLW